MNDNNNNEVPNGDNNGQGVYQFKLISVNFKEAALDSPSFRANVNHLDNQTDNLEEWLLALSKSLKKLSEKLEEIRMFSNSFLENLVPGFLQDGLIDQEYTTAALRITLESTKQRWDKNLRDLKIYLPSIDSMNRLVLKSFSEYRETRKRFESAQEKYDKYLRIFLSTPKAKHPSMIQEDSQQLYSVRKTYLHESLQLVIELTNLGNLLDRKMIELTHEVWRKKGDFNDNDFEMKDSWQKIQKIKRWSEMYTEALSKIGPDMLAARNQVEQSSYLQFAPSSNLDDYTYSFINSKTLSMTDEASVEKHGYLFMKTSGRKSKPSWVKRWVFIKNGVFGLLVLSPSKTFVQETDKIGILLCNVKYASNEDRRFCFEVKTIDQTITFQAETFDDLKSWLKVFENDRKRVFQEAKEDPSKKIIASGRYPPMITELSSTVNSSVDRELTNTMITDSSTGQIIASSSLSSHIVSNQKAFENDVYSQIPKIKPPLMTSTTKSSILAYSLISPSSVPTALTANIWGSVNWGLYHMHEITAQSTDKALTEGNEEEVVFAEDNLYPSYYPTEWISTDIEMRALFETAIGDNEVCLFSYRSLWSPNSKQELNGKCYITTKYVYFYLQALGFNSLTKLPVASIFSVDYSAQSNFDYLKLYSIEGIIKVKLFLDNGKLIKQKFSYLINNNTKEKPDKLLDIIRNFKKIERDLAFEKKNSLKSDRLTSRNVDLPRKITSGTKNSFVPSENGNKVESFQINFSEEGKLFFVKTYPVPPKALFHALLGENSVMLRTNDLFIQLDSFVKKSWTVTPDNHSTRSLTIPISYRGRSRGKIRMDQNIFNYDNDDYFTFTLKKSRIKFFVGGSFSIYQRFVIAGVAGKQSEVYAYCNIIFDKWSIFNPLLARICTSLGKYYFYKLDTSLNEVVRQVGKHGVVAKAIYLYGKLGFTTEEEPIDESPVLYLYFKDIAFLLIEKSVLRYYGVFVRTFRFWLRILVQLIVSLKMNQFLVFIILISGCFNLFLSSRATTSYWSARKANQVAQQYVNSQPKILSKAIYLQDVKELTQNKFSAASFNTTDDSRCFSTFRDVSFVLNSNKLFWDNEYGDEETRLIAKKLMKTYHDIAVKRNEILIKLNMLNHLEEEISKGEWVNWLSSELNKCAYIKNSMLDDTTKEALDNLTLDDIMDYCDSCYRDQALVGLI